MVICLPFKLPGYESLRKYKVMLSSDERASCRCVLFCGFVLTLENNVIPNNSNDI